MTADKAMWRVETTLGQGLAGASADDLSAELLSRAIQRGALAIARAEASLAGLRRNQDARVREWGRLLIRREAKRGGRR